MLCVLGSRSTVLPVSWGDNPGSISYSIYLTKWVTHNPSTAVRATTSLRGERAQQAAYSLPSPWAASRRERLRLCTQSACRFSPIAYRTSLQYGKYSCVSSACSEEKSAEASCAQSLCAAALLFSRALFSTTLPTLLGTSRLNSFHDFSRQISFLSVLCSIVGMCSFERYFEGDGEGGKRGTGGENPEGEGGLQPGCPPFPGLSPQAPVERYCVSGARRL